MNCVAIFDTHGFHGQLELPKGDLIIHAGDFCHLGNNEHMHDFLDWFSKLDYEHKIFIGGNHDYFAFKHPNDFDLIIPEGVSYLNDSGSK